MIDHETLMGFAGQIAAILAAKEPIFHVSELGTSRKDFERMMAPEFWEVGASGTVYSRDQVLAVLEQRHRTRVTESLCLTDFLCQKMAPRHYLVTYLLDQDGRFSRRATLWRHTGDGWKIVYHQGTLVAN
ncbi:MAG: DUF4440 domain-containing protein [Pseudoxanthomonas sp.]